MPIDFFTQGQKSTSDKELFGICDDTTIGKKAPAYINDSDPDKWIAEVHNQSQKSIDFFAIDCCIKWSLPNGNQAKACDGMLVYNKKYNVIFVELKNKNPRYKNVNKNPKKKDWVEEAIDQLKSTIEFFRSNHIIDGTSLKAYASNKQAIFDEGWEDYMEKVKDETGVTLRVFREIEIQ